MGAAATIELQKPVDASEIRNTGNVGIAKAELMRLRASLGHLAKDAGFAEVKHDVSDLCLGENEQEDFERCVEGIAHIRRALQLSTQRSRRETRQYIPPMPEPPPAVDNGEDSDSSDDSSVNEENTAS